MITQIYLYMYLSKLMFSLNEPNCIIIYLFSLLLQIVGGLRPKLSRTDRLYRIFDYFAVSSSSKSGGSTEGIFYKTG